MSAFSRIMNSVDDSQGDHQTNSTSFNSTKQIQKERTSNVISNSSPLTSEGTKDPRQNESSTLHSGSTATTEPLVGQSKTGAHSHHESLTAGDLDSTFTALADTVAPDANISADQADDQTSQIASNFGSLLGTSNTGSKSLTTPKGLPPAPQAPSAASTNPARHADHQLTGVQNIQPENITHKIEPPAISNHTGSLSSITQSKLNSSAEAHVSQKATFTATDESGSEALPLNLPASLNSSETESDGIRRSHKQHDDSDPLSASLQPNLTRSQQGELFQKENTASGPKALPLGHAPHSNPKTSESEWKTISDTKSAWGNYDVQQKQKIDQQTSDRISVIDNDDSPRRVPIAKQNSSSTTRLQSSSSRQKSSDSSLEVSSIPLAALPLASGPKSSPLYPSGISSSGAAGTDSVGRIPNDQNYPVPSSHKQPKDALNHAPPPLGTLPIMNSTLSDITPLESMLPCQVADQDSSKKSTTGSVPQIGCQNTTDLYSANQPDNVKNLKSPAALRQTSRHSSEYSSNGDLDYNKPFPIISGGKQNTGMDRATSTTQYKPYTSKTSQTVTDTRLSNHSSSISASSIQSSSSTKANYSKLSTPESNQGPKTNRTSTIDFTGVLGKAPSLNSTNPLVAGLDNQKDLQRELSPKVSSPSLGGGSIINDSNSTNSMPSIQASASSNSTMKISTNESQGRVSTFSESRDPSGNSRGSGSSVDPDNQKESTIKQQGPKEWRISVQNSSSGFSASQRLEKAVNTTQSRILDSKMIENQNRTQSFNLTQSHSTSQRMDSRLGKSTRYSAQDGAESSPEPKTSNSTGDSSSSVPTQDKQQPPEKSQSSSWIAPPILPSSSAGPQPGLQVSTGGKITVISVGLGFSIGVLILAVVGGLMRRKILRKHQSSVIHISRPQSQSVEDDNSSFSSPRQSSLEDGMHDFNARFEPGYQPSDHEQEIGVDPFGVSYHVNHDRYESHASSFGNFTNQGLPTDQVHYRPDQLSSSHPHEPQGSAPRRSDDTSLIPITFPHFEEQQRRGPLGHEDQDYGRPEVLPHSATPWHPHQEQCNDDSATEVATRFSDGETMFDDGRDAPPFISDWVPPVPPLDLRSAE
ncbi:hypothetical protein MJO28_003838 [Puccinia striiformis f. sp. tritici]|uniref:Uncharacterized protein n=2 Tax=Puccinia striiformis TaxID=27350 RepID=A0A2S4VJC0_9BASI|nr:hypothetical protein MJO28_003838 [Puccinia striiformis f. sp. tritici]POW09632.1 hypothetical protein PSTT_06673 [Puccinia striiformis]